MAGPDVPLFCRFAERVARTAGVLDPRTRTLRIKAECDEATAFLRPGMFGTLTATIE